MMRRTRLKKIRTLIGRLTDFLRGGWYSRNLSGLANRDDFPIFTFQYSLKGSNRLNWYLRNPFLGRCWIVFRSARGNFADAKRKELVCITLFFFFLNSAYGIGIVPVAARKNILVNKGHRLPIQTWRTTLQHACNHSVCVRGSQGKW